MMRRIFACLSVFVWMTSAAFAQSWTSPRNWVATEVVTAAQMNAHVRDNLSVLRAGGFAVTSQATGDLLCASSSTQFGRLDGSIAVGSLLVSVSTSACPAFTTTLADTTGYTISGASATLTLSGATAPSILFSAADALITSNTDVVFRVDNDNNSTSVFEFQNSGAVVVATISEAGSMYLNDNANGFMTSGLTIQQGAADDEIFALKSADVAHGMTTVTETDTYFLIQKWAGASGGAYVAGYSEDILGLGFVARVTSGDTTKSSAATGAVQLYGQKKSGTTVTSMGANENILVLLNNATAVGVFDAEGDLWLGGNLMLETGSSPAQGTPVSTGTTTWGTTLTTVWMGTPAVWFVVLNESGTSYRVPGYAP